MNKVTAIFYGIIAASGAAIFQQLILILLNIEIINTDRLTPLLIFGAMSEEIFKFLVIYKLSTEEENSWKLIVNSLFVGLGFSLIELTFKIWGNWQNIQTYFFDYLGIILIHLLTAVIIGYFLTLKKFPGRSILAGFIIALVFHLAYNSLQIYLF